MNFKGDAKRLESLDISRLAHTIGCGEDHLHAVMEVETRGGGFDRHGRIKMLFEPHVFFRELSGSERVEAVKLGLAYERWGERPYPSDSYPRLQAAMRINPEAALRSCSWGLGQIMGFNCKLAGYQSVEAMVGSFRNDEDTHLAAMVQFIISAGLDDDLRREDWRGFARGYNGSGYAKHGYHLKLKRAFDKWQRIPDTPFEIDRSVPNPNPPEEPILSTRGMFLERGMSGPDVKNLQGILHDLRYPVGEKDSKFGPLLEAAVVSFQVAEGLVPDGKVGELTWEALANAEARKLRPTTMEQLVDKSRTASVADQGRKIAKGTKNTILGGLTLSGTLATGEAVASAKPMLLRLQELLAQAWPILGVAALVLIVALLFEDTFKKILGFRLEDDVNGYNLK